MKRKPVRVRDLKPEQVAELKRLASEHQAPPKPGNALYRQDASISEEDWFAMPTGLEAVEVETAALLERSGFLTKIPDVHEAGKSRDAVVVQADECWISLLATKENARLENWAQAISRAVETGRRFERLVAIEHFQKPVKTGRKIIDANKLRTERRHGTPEERARRTAEMLKLYEKLYRGPGTGERTYRTIAKRINLTPDSVKRRILAARKKS